jgi:hypothetical protein
VKPDPRALTPRRLHALRGDRNGSRHARVKQMSGTVTRRQPLIVGLVVGYTYYTARSDHPVGGRPLIKEEERAGWERMGA